MLQHKVHNSASILMENARVLQASGEYVRALKVLDAIVPNNLRQNALELSEYYYLLAYCLFKHGRHAQALPRVRAAIRLCQRSAEHRLFAYEKQLLGRLYMRLGRHTDATNVFMEAYAARKRVGDCQGYYGPLANIGLSHLMSGDLAAARKSLDQALLHAQKYNAPPQIFLCKLNLSILTMLQGDFTSHDTLLNSVRHEPLGVEETAHVQIHVGQGKVWRLQYDEAQTNLKQAMVTYIRRKLSRDYVVCLEYLGMNEYFAGNYAKAKEYYQQVLDTPEPTASAVAQTLRMLTDVYVAEGDWKNAKETASKAEIAITKINERIELAALWRAQAQIAENECDQSAARDLFQKSIDLLQQCGVRYELALTHFAAGQSLVYSTAERSEHLQQAKDLFVEMDVPKRVAQVDAAIVRIGSKLVIPAIAGKSKRASRVIITVNPKMRMILNQIEQTRDSDMTVLITGETGTGKDLLAEYIHYASKRAKGPFVNENSAAFSETLIEAELFGYNRGAFSGAVENKPGLIESAAGGTFCFNEIAEIPTSLQAKLLKLLETKTVRRLGDVKDREIDVRFIAMTNRKLAVMVKQGGFREDLYHRLQQMTFHLPPLRERIEDISPLFEYFLALCGISPTQIETAVYEEMLTHLCAHQWQGNVRELSNFAGHLANLNGDFNSASILAMVANLRSRRG